MKVVLIKQSLYHIQTEDAFVFIKQNIQDIALIFFWQNAIDIVNKDLIFAKNEENLQEKWQRLISDNQLNAKFCRTSAIKRGVVNYIDEIQIGSLLDFNEASMKYKNIIF